MDLPRRSRMQALLMTTALCAFAACSGIRLDQRLVVSEEDWASDGGNPARVHLAEGTGAPFLPLEEAWRYNAVAAFGPGSPLVVDSVVFVGNLKGEVHVVRLEDGKKLGSKKLASAVTGGLAFSGALLFVPNAWGRTVLQAYDVQNGRRVWAHRGVPIETGLLAIDELLIAVDIEANVYAFDQRTGEEIWVHATDPSRVFSASPVAASGRVFVADDRGDVTALSLSDGAVHWTRSAGAPVLATPTAGEDLLYVPTTRGRFSALDLPSGETAWTFQVRDSLVRFSSAAVSKERLVFGGTDGVVRALDPATGGLVWSFETDGNVTAAPLIAGDAVFVGTHDRRLVAIEAATGRLLWETSLRGRVRSSLAVAGETVLVLAEPRFVYAFVPASDSTDTREEVTVHPSE